jgi:hypothetical protein
VVAAGNPRKVYELADLLRPDLRFINRQLGSGTRLLLETRLAQAAIVPAAIAGFEQGAFTHAAVAAYVASGMADVGFGLETPARRFKLDFIPLATEPYFLLCRQVTVGGHRDAAAAGHAAQRRLSRRGRCLDRLQTRPHRPRDAAARGLWGCSGRPLTRPLTGHKATDGAQGY